MEDYDSNTDITVHIHQGYPEKNKLKNKVKRFFCYPCNKMKTYFDDMIKEEI